MAYTSTPGIGETLVKTENRVSELIQIQKLKGYSRTLEGSLTLLDVTNFATYYLIYFLSVHSDSIQINERKFKVENMQFFSNFSDDLLASINNFTVLFYTNTLEVDKVDNIKCVFKDFSYQEIEARQIIYPTKKLNLIWNSEEFPYLAFLISSSVVPTNISIDYKITIRNI